MPRARALPHGLNYHHLHHFAAVATHGSVVRAARALGVRQPTVSAQVAALERALGEPLFERRPRGLVLTELGRVVARYAEEIFGLGRELGEVLRGRPEGRVARFTVGIAHTLPKLTTVRLLRPALARPEAFTLSLRVDHPERLLADLATHALDLVLTDAPATAGLGVRAFAHPLAALPIAIYGVAGLRARTLKGFPRSLDGAPFLLPAGGALRRTLDEWFAAHRVTPRVTGEADDLGLLQALGARGLGLFAAPAAVARDLRVQYDVRPLGRLAGVRQLIFALTVERRLRHPAAAAIEASAKSAFET